MKKFVKLMLIALSTASANAADTRLPAKFIGDWCTNLDKNTELYKRCKNGYEPEGSFLAQPTRLLIAGEVECKVIRGEPRPNGYYVTAQCTHSSTDDRWVYRSLLSRRGAQLSVKDVE